MNKIEEYLNAVGYEKKGYVDLDRVVIGMKMYTRNIVCKHNQSIVYDKYTTNTLDGKYCRLKFRKEHNFNNKRSHIVYVKLSELEFDRDMYKRNGRVEFWVNDVLVHRIYDSRNIEDKLITGMYIENEEV